MAGIALILLLALGLRLGWSLSRPVDDASIDALPDQREYLSLARNLLDGRGLQFWDGRFSATVWAFRTPGYPLFLAAGGGNIRAARTVQALLDTSTVLAIFLLARSVAPELGRQRLGLVAAALVAVNPYLIYFSGLILSETLFTAMLVWGMVLLVHGGGGRDRSWRKTAVWLCGGGLLALSVLVRPSAIALPVVLGIVAAFVNRSNRADFDPGRTGFRGPLLIGLTMGLLVVAALLPWGLRNHRILGRWVWLDTSGGFTLYDGYNPAATGGSDQSFIQHDSALKTLSEVDRSDYLSHTAMEYVRDHPGRVWELVWLKLARTWSPMPLSREYGRPIYRLIGLTYSLPFDVWIILGLWCGALPRSAKVFLIAPAIYLSAVHALTVGSLRYRMPAEGPMAIVAAGLVATRGVADPDWRRSHSHP